MNQLHFFLFLVFMFVLDLYFQFSIFVFVFAFSNVRMFNFQYLHFQFPIFVFEISNICICNFQVQHTLVAVVGWPLDIRRSDHKPRTKSGNSGLSAQLCKYKYKSKHRYKYTVTRNAKKVLIFNFILFCRGYYLKTEGNFGFVLESFEWHCI